MKHILSKGLLIVSLFFVVNGCEEKDLYNRKQEDKEITALKKEIENIANQHTCENAGEWKFTAIGSKACGGPTGYIAYAVKIDEAEFLEKVALYTEKQKAYNVKWDVASDCMFVMPPKGIECVDGKPKFVY
ncbi:hypothetical protein FA048_17265 [Pedobacter polaris]|uniref:Uncharacterized protein n=1 Tax=Pedobacter polaris TaxID=2571273 RepID=A0A4U1CFT0_9SPHI|nr:hypothetical protein [Pedobacter polaris]TKC05478.1 hypothetical protein FA048_17265 [Pedobacter polaris]